MKPARTFVTADWHLFHDRLVESGERPDGFTELLIARHREVLRPQDTLINLGDVIFYRLPELRGVLAGMPCTHILVMGNHDSKSRGWFMRSGFTYAADMIVLGDVAFSHRPLSALPDGARWNVHGHLHRHREYADRRPFHRLLAMEDTGYRPVLLDSFLAERAVAPGEQEGGR